MCVYRIREKYFSLKFLAKARSWLGLSEKNMWRGLWKINLCILPAPFTWVSQSTLHQRRINYATLALLNPRGICSMECSGGLCQVVRVGFLTWPRLRRAVSLLLCPPSPPPSSSSHPLPKSSIVVPWAADPFLLLPSAPPFLHTFLASCLLKHFGKCSPDPKEFTG